jgi:hypothetical protein
MNKYIKEAPSIGNHPGIFTFNHQTATRNFQGKENQCSQVEIYSEMQTANVVKKPVLPLSISLSRRNC